MEGGLLTFVLLIAGPALAWLALSRIEKLRQHVERLQRTVTDLKLELMLKDVPPRAETPRPSAPPKAEPATTSIPPTRVIERPAPPRETPPQVAPPQPPPVIEPAAPPASDWARTSASIERMVAANWLVWLGAAALALGGIFLVRFAWEQGYFGPELRTLAAIIAGVAMIVGSEWLYRRIPADAEGHIGYAPLAVAAAGSLTLYGAAYAAGPLYQLVPSQLTLVGYVAASVVAIVLAMRHGVFLAMLGLAGGFAAPLLVGGGEPEPVPLLSYAFVVTLAGLVLVRAFDWRPVVWVALIGAGVWMLLGAMMTGHANGSLAVAVYALALVLAATVLAWSDADRFVITPGKSGATFPAETVAAAYGFWIISGLGLLVAFATADDGLRDPAMAALAIYGSAAVFVGWRKAGFRVMPLMGVVAFLAGLGIAPLDIAWSTPVEGGGFQPFGDPSAYTYRFLALAWAGASLVGAGGWLAMRTMKQDRTIMAVVSAFTPLLILIIAFHRLGQDQQHFVWGFGGAAIALLNLAALEGLRRAPGGLDSAKGAAAAYALGAFAASMFGVGASLGEMWMTLLIAAHLPAIAMIDRRFGLPALKLCASVAGLVAMARLLSPVEIASYQVSTMPVFNELTVLYGAALLLFWGAARLYTVNFKSAEAPLVQAFDVAAIVLLTVLVTVQIRHFAGGGSLVTSSAVGVVEIGAYAVAFISLAMGLVARMGSTPRQWPGLAAQGVYWLAVVVSAAGLGLAFNPLLNGSLGANLDGPPLLNLIAASYLPPAILFIVHAVQARRMGQVWQSQLSAFIALGLAFLYVTLEVRNAYQGDMSVLTGSVSEVESYTYSIVWLLFAVAVLLVGLIRKQVAIRHAAMAVLALSVGKVFILDMSSLTGVLRAVSFMGLGLALIAIAYLYQRLVFRRAEA